jgi:peroxiredoxin
MLFISVRAQNSHCTITGETEGFKDSTMLYLHDSESNQIVDSVLILNNKFKFDRVLNEPQQFVIATSFKKREDLEYVFFWAEPVEIKIHAIKGQLKQAAIKGSVLQDQAAIYNKMMYPIDKSIDSVQNKMMSVGMKDTLLFKSLLLKENELRSQITKIEKQFISEHPDFLHGVYILTFTMRRISKEETKELFSKLTDVVKTSKYGTIVRNYVENSKKIGIGDKAVDFHLENLKGEKIGLCDFKTKYVLMEFWGSGCGPCRMENPNLLKNYKAYKDKGFNIVSISLDKNRKEMEMAIRKDSMIWTTVSDLQGINGLVPTIYNVTFIPKNYLINPDGIIIAMDLRGDELNKKLKEIFKK